MKHLFTIPTGQGNGKLKPLIQTIFNLFNKNKKQHMETRKTEVVITTYSQSHVLQHRMREAGLKHGDKVTANLERVRLEPAPPNSYANQSRMTMYFCPMEAVEVVKKLERGDGLPLPHEATLVNFILKGTNPINSGYYNLKNVTLFSNGTLQVIANEDTVLEGIDDRGCSMSEAIQGRRCTMYP